MTEVYQALKLDMQQNNGGVFPNTFREDRYDGHKGLQISKNLLIVDDCKDLLHILGKCFAIYAYGFNILTAINGVEAIKVLGSMPVEILLTDLYMPGMNGFELACFTKNNYPRTQIFAMSGDDKDILENKLNYLGISACIRKPFGIDMLMSVVLNKKPLRIKKNLSSFPHSQISYDIGQQFQSDSNS